MNQLKAFEEYIKENYQPEHGGNDACYENGNMDDSFESGMELGKVWAIYEIAQIFGIKLEKPHDHCDSDE